MAFSPLALIFIPIGYFFMWPLVARWLGHNGSSPLETALMALELSVGTLALLLMWIGLLPRPWLTTWTALVIVMGGLGIGLAANPGWVALKRWQTYWLARWRQLVTLDFNGLLLLTIIGVTSIMLIHTLYYPFIGDDTISRYALQAAHIYEGHRISESVWGYPPLAPLSFAVTWFAAGQIHEPLARLFSFMMTLGTLGATYLIGKQVLGVKAGLPAMTLAALTPMLIRNGTLGYTDIPTTFPLTLAALYALRWWQSGSGRDAILVGMLSGLALLTKQSALTWLVSFAAVPLMWLIGTRRQFTMLALRQALIGLGGMLIPAILIAAPWYIRNGLLSNWHEVIPIAGLYHLLGDKTGWLGLLPSLAWWTDFGPVTGLIHAAGWIIGFAQATRQGIHVLRGKIDKPPADLILAAIILPYWLAWWTRFSFEGRFLLLILPPMAVWGARPLVWAIDRIGERIRLPRQAWQLGGAILLAGLALWAARDRLGSVYWAVTRPFDSYDEKLLRAKGRMYNLVLYARQHFDPANDRLVLMDGRLAYYLRDFDYVVMYPRSLADLEGYDYLIHASSMVAVYNDRVGLRNTEFYQHVWDPLIFEPVYVSEGVHIMRILRTDLPSPEEYEAYNNQHQEP